MSKFEELNDAQKIERLRGLGKTALGLSLGSLGILIARGFVSPDELSALLNPVLRQMEATEAGSDEEFSAVIDQFANLKKLAAQTWKGK